MAKNIISLESCRNTLIKETKANLRTLLLLLPAMLVIFVPLICLAMALFADDDLNRVGQILTGIIFTSIFAALPVYFIYQIINELFKLKMISAYNFSIVKDTVIRVEKVMKRRHEETVAHFKNYGEFSISRTQYDLTSTNDEFYLVILNCNKRILSAYPTATNDFSDTH